MTQPCACVQCSGAFKFRGALNAILCLTDAERQKVRQGTLAAGPCRCLQPCPCPTARRAARLRATPSGCHLNILTLSSSMRQRMRQSHRRSCGFLGRGDSQLR